MTSSTLDLQAIAFIGGGNMASALIGGLRRQGLEGDLIEVVEPMAEQRQRLQAQWGVRTCEQAHAGLGRAALVVWAIKPQEFAEAAAQTAPHTPKALHLSVAAGISTDSMAAWLSSQRIVRAMPNTPALIGRGITGLYARPAVSAQERHLTDEIPRREIRLSYIDTAGVSTRDLYRAFPDDVALIAGVPFTENHLAFLEFLHRRLLDEAIKKFLTGVGEDRGLKRPAHKRFVEVSFHRIDGGVEL